jgi:hypothetical protein
MEIAGDAAETARVLVASYGDSALPRAARYLDLSRWALEFEAAEFWFQVTEHVGRILSGERIDI